MTNYLADELRQIEAELDGDLVAHAGRERLRRLVGHVEKLGEETVETTTTTETRELDLVVSGLEPDQEIRSRALDATARIYLFGVPNDGYSPGGYRDTAAALAVAEVFADYIRGGSMPATSDEGTP